MLNLTEAMKALRLKIAALEQEEERELRAVESRYEEQKGNCRGTGGADGAGL